MKRSGATPDGWDELEGLVDQLLDAPSEQRARLLEELTGSDRDRRAQLERLLAECEREYPLLDRPAGERFDALLEDAPTPVPEVLAERYRIVRELGRGGMAVVYLARDERHDRDVAVKVVRREFAEARGRARFLREIGIAARLKHPHIVPLFDSGEVGPVLYYVMPYEEGDTLRARLAREGPLPVPEVLRIVRQVSDALAYAHQQGVVHRDIKPENVLLSGRHAMVSDFGVARALAVAAEGHELTTQGGVLGTRAYMAPEQASAAPIDHRVDLFALGVMAYEMLAGERPFGERSAPRSADDHALASAFLTRRRPDLPAGVVAVVMKCLSDDPGARYQSAEQILTELEVVAGVDAAETRRATAWGERLTRSDRLRGFRPWTIPVAVAATAGAVALVLATRSDGLPPTAVSRPLTLGIAPVVDASPDSAFGALAAGIENHLAIELTPVAGLRLRQSETIAALAKRGWTPESIALVHGIEYFVEVTLSPGGRDSLAVALLLTEGGIQTVLSEPLPQMHRGAPNLVTTLGKNLAERIRTSLGTRIRDRELETATADSLALRYWRSADQYRLRMRRRLKSGDAVAAALALDSAEMEFLRSEARDKSWSTPRIARASLQEWRAFMLQISGDTNRRRLEATYNAGVASLDSVIRRARRDALALTLRGRLRLERELGMERHGLAQAAALDSARRDLQQALDIDSLLPRPAAELSRISYQLGKFEDAAEYAERAYRLDRYLENAGTIINLLALSLLETKRDAEAAHWCAEGMQRFSDDPSHYGAALEVMAWGNVPAKPDTARKWLDAVRRIQEDDAGVAAHYTAVFAGILARTPGTPRDSARAVLSRARAFAARLDSTDRRYWSYLASHAAVRFRLSDRAIADSLIAELRRRDREAGRRFQSRALSGYVHSASNPR